MPENESYATRSKRHQHNGKTQEETSSPNNGESSQTQKSLEQSLPKKSYKQKKGPGKHIFTLVSILVFVIVATAGYILFTLKQEEALAKEKYENATQELLAKVQEEQNQSGVATTEKESSAGQITSVLYLPEDPATIPFENGQQTLTDLVKSEKDKVTDDKAVIVGRVTATSVTEKLKKYELVVDNYQWDPKKEAFEAPKTNTDKTTYVATATGKAVTIPDLIPEEGDLLAIQQVIQQKILDGAQDPNAILDAVLALPRISYETKMTYTPDSLKIQLPENNTGVQEISLEYRDIAGFIDTNLVDPATIKDALPVLDETKKYVALTFDDGPNNTSTLQLLDILKQNNVKATFFMLGQMVEQNPDVAKRVHDEGHEIGTHSYSHPQLNTLSEDELKDQIYKTDTAIFHAIGQLPRNIRPPYGAIDAASAKIIGKPVIQWDVDSMDWDLRNPDLIANNVIQHVYDGSIILIHDIHETSVNAVPAIIQNLKGQGYEFVTIDQLLRSKQIPLHQYFGMNDERLIN